MLARAATLASQAQHGHSASEVVLAADGDAPPVLVKNPERQVPPLVKGTSLRPRVGTAVSAHLTSCQDLRVCSLLFYTGTYIVSCLLVCHTWPCGLDGQMTASRGGASSRHCTTTRRRPPSSRLGNTCSAVPLPCFSLCWRSTLCFW